MRGDMVRTRDQLAAHLSQMLRHLPYAAHDARQLVLHVCGCSQEDYICRPDAPVSFDSWHRAVRLAERRTKHEPLAYLLRMREFYGRPFFVDRHVLIPRPESEHIVERALPFVDDRTLVVDVGTGSGALAVTLATLTHRPTVATDRSWQALRVARRNARRHQTPITFRRGHLLDALRPRDAYGTDRAVIVANLPYLNQAMLEASPEEVHLHEPHGALMSDANDGLNLYRELIDHLHRHRHVLPKDRILVFEIDPRQGSSATKMARDLAPHATFSLHHDLASRPRVVVLEGV